MQAIVAEENMKLCSNPDLQWGNANITFMSLHAPEKRLAIEQISARSIEFFGADRVNKPSFQEGLERQIYQARRTWVNSVKAKERKAARSEVGSGLPSPASPFPEQPVGDQEAPHLTGSHMGIRIESGAAPESDESGPSQSGPGQSGPEGPHSALPFDPVRHL